MGRPDFQSRGPKTTILKGCRGISLTPLSIFSQDNSGHYQNISVALNFEPKARLLKGCPVEGFGAKIWGAPNADPTTTDPMPHSRPSDRIAQVVETSKIAISWNHFVLIEIWSVETLVTCLRISTGLTRDSVRKTDLWEHFGRTDNIALTTRLKYWDVSGAFQILTGLFAYSSPCYLQWGGNPFFSSGAWRGAPGGVATLKVRKGDFDALNDRPEALGKVK